MNYLKKNLHVARKKIINREQYVSMMDQSFLDSSTCLYDTIG